jgi:predicted PurR-regulated permease PerM
MTDIKNVSGVERSLLIIALFLIICIAIKMTAYIFNLLIISFILALLALPVLNLLKRRGMSHGAAVAVVTAAAALCLLVLILLTMYSFNVLMADLPLYQAEFNQRVSDITSLLDYWGISAGSFFPTSLDFRSLAGMVMSSALSIGDTLLYVFFIAVTTLFLLLEAPHITARIEKLLVNEPEKLRQMAGMSRYVIDFMIVRTETNLVHGLLFGGILSLMGVHAAMLWGILTFILGYIPYLGLVIAAVPAIFFAYLQFGVWGAFAVVAVVCVLNLLVENPVFSYLASRRFEIPAIIVILSVIFWGWLLGLPGMLFSVPITLMVLILIQGSDELRWVNVLLGVSHLFEDGMNHGAKNPDKETGSETG